MDAKRRSGANGAAGTNAGHHPHTNQSDQSAPVQAFGGPLTFNSCSACRVQRKLVQAIKFPANDSGNLAASLDAVFIRACSEGLSGKTRSQDVLRLQESICLSRL